MKTLPADNCRCAGRIDIAPDAPACPRREECYRYVAFSRLDPESGISHYFRTPLITGMPECDFFKPLPSATHE